MPKDLAQDRRDRMLEQIRQDPLAPSAKAAVRRAIDLGISTHEVARAIRQGLEGVHADYWVALQEGKLERDDSDLFRIRGMLRYLRSCREDERRLAAFLGEETGFFEMLGRTTSWTHEVAEATVATAAGRPARQPLVLEIYRRLNTLDALLERRLAPFGLTPAQYRLLDLLRDGPEVPSGLALALGQRRQQVAPVLRRLELTGLVERRPGPGGDRARSAASLTDRGRAVLNQVDPVVHRVYRAVFTGNVVRAAEAAMAEMSATLDARMSEA